MLFVRCCTYIPGGCPNPSVIELVFVVDASRSVNADEWNYTKDFLRDIIVHGLDFESGYVRVAVITFSNFAILEWGLDE